MYPSLEGGGTITLKKVKVMGLKLSEVSYRVSGKDTEYVIETKDENGMSIWTDDLKILPKELLEKLEEKVKELKTLLEK